MRAAARRRAEEIAEAKALGVRVVCKVNLDRTWNEREMAVLRKLWPVGKAIASKLPHRSPSAIRAKGFELGLAVRNAVWTNDEVALLRKIYRTASHDELQIAFSGKTLSQLRRKADAIGYQRGIPPYKSTGNWLCDEIRDRCRILGYSMPQMDAMAKTGKYWQQAQWLKKLGHAWSPMIKAAKALGGDLRIEWPDDGASYE